MYLFDPLYYEKTEPFASGLTKATGADKSQALEQFLDAQPSLTLGRVNNYLMSLSQEAVEVRPNLLGVVVKVIDKNRGLLR